MVALAVAHVASLGPSDVPDKTHQHVVRHYLVAHDPPTHGCAISGLLVRPRRRRSVSPRQIAHATLGVSNQG
jgi:hypothetical protein